MALSHGATPIVTDGLVLCIDAGNSAKGYDLKQNYFPNSEDITTQTGGWLNNTASNGDFGGSGTQAITTANYGIAPDGTQTADRIQLDKGSGTNSGDRSGIRYNLSMVNRTLSYYVKFLDSTTIEQFTTSVYPQGTTWTYDTLSDGWYRVKCTGSTSSTVRIQYVGGEGGAEQTSLDALVWGIQLEDGSVATDYVKTTGTAKEKQVFDLSGGGNTGILVNGVGYSNGSLVFDGVNDYVNLGNNINSSISPHLDCTFSIWFNLNDILSADRVLFSQPTISSNNPIVCWHDIVSGVVPANSGVNDIGGGINNVITVLITDSTQEYRYTTSENILSANTWYNLCVVINPTNDVFRAYLNANEVSRFNSSNCNGIKSSTDNFSIGSSTGGSSMSGNVSNFSIYNRALTQSEIQQNFNALRGRYGI